MDEVKSTLQAGPKGHDQESNFIQQVRESRRRSNTTVEVFTPYAVHGLSEALGLKRSRLPKLCLILGLAGAVFATVFQLWASAINWPINVGGKPWNSLPAFVPIAFEAAILVAGLGTVLAFFVVSRLWPGRKPATSHSGVTNNQFAIQVGDTRASDEARSVAWTARALPGNLIVIGLAVLVLVAVLLCLCCFISCVGL